MSKITDADYYLPYIFAVSPLGEASTGTTAPVIIRGIDEKTGEEGDEYYVKPVGAPRMSGSAPMFELLAAFIAKQLDLNVAEPALINISTHFADICKGKPYHQKIANSIGINFGTRNFGGAGFVDWLPQASLPYNLQQEALKIFIFDLLIQNTDRGHQKENLNINAKGFKIFDHELAFSYTMLIGAGIQESWRLYENDIDKDLIFKHLFYKHLKGKRDLPVEKSCELLQHLTPAFWERAEQLMPPGWIGRHFFIIKEHTEGVINHLNQFTNEIRRVLS